MNNTLIYSERTQSFSSFLSSKPKFYLNFGDRFYSFDDDNNMLLHNNDPANPNELSTPPVMSGNNVIHTHDKSTIKYIVNPSYSLTKIFDNTEIVSTGLENIDELVFTSDVGLSRISTSSSFLTRDGLSVLAIPRASEGDTQDSLQPFSPRMRGKYLECNLELNADAANTLNLPYIKTSYRQSII